MQPQISSSIKDKEDRATPNFINPGDNPYTSNIPRYFVYLALKGLGFGLITAIWVIYLQQRRGLSLGEATLIDVSLFVAAALGEIPTGLVADTFGRKTSLAVGAALMSGSILAWAFAPTMPLIMLAYVAMGIGLTFLSGAEDAFFYESVQLTGRGDEYVRLAGRAGATMLGAIALGNVASGLLATFDLILPFLIGSLTLLIMLGIILTFKEPQNRAEEKSDGTEPVRISYGAVLRKSLALVRTRPSLRYPMFYLALVPLAAVILETFFVQPQAVALGIPLAAIGVIVMAVQITNMLGSSYSYWIKQQLGERRVIYIAPMLITGSLVGLAALQVMPALLFIAAIGFVTAVLQPLLLSRVQAEVSDDIRATLLSVQSLLATMLLAISEPILGVIADRSGLPTSYVALAGGFAIMVALLFVISRRQFPGST